jgi:outer membrane receptor protein involved in Fe transport
MRSSSTARTLTSFLTLTLFLVALVFVFAAPASAQTVTGTLKGTVVDPNGAAVAGAAVTVKSETTGVEKSTTTSGDGNFEVPNLTPGKYTITVPGTGGFSGKTVTGVDLRLGLTTDVKVDLAVGSTTASVTVTAETETTIQTSTSQISSSFETRKVQDLPSNAAGNGIDTLALLAPGVVPGFGNVNSDGTTLSVNGNRARANNFTIDGTDNNDLSIGGPSYFVDNQDAVQEYQVITNNFSAQYGRNQGAVVNIVLKSGGNEFHGSAFEFLRNSALDAETNLERRDPGRSAPNTGKGKNKFISNVFGGTVGGPIKKNKAFFFFTFQDIRQATNSSVSGTSLAPLPSQFPLLLAQYPGNAAIKAFVSQSAFAVTVGGVKIQPRVDSASASQRLCFPKNPTLAYSTAANCGALPNDFTVLAALPLFTWKTPFIEPEYSIRGDMNVTKKDSFYIRYLYQKSPETLAQFSNEFLSDVPFSSRNLSGTYTRQISSHATNEFRATWQKLAVIFGGGCTDTLTGCILDPFDGIDKTFTNITLSSISGNLGTSVRAIGPATNLPQGRAVTVLQFNDNLTFVKGRHSFSAGVDIRHLTSSVPFLPNINGAFTFSNTAQLVANDPLRVILVGGKSTLDYPENDKFFYFQDDWKVRDNLTLNLGVRYEYTGQPINLLNEISAAREADPAQALWLQTLPVSARSVAKVPNDKNNWAPRLGFAYTPHWGEGKMAKALFGGNDGSVIRGGFSIAYDPAFYNILLNVSTSAPMVFNNTINNNVCNNGACPGPATFQMPTDPTGTAVRAALGGNLVRNFFDPRLQSETIVGSDFHSPYSEQWSLGIQRQINRNNVAEIRYVGNHGVGLFQTLNRNPFLGADTLNTTVGNACLGQFTNGGIAHGFCAVIGGAAHIFPAFPQLLNGITPLSTAQCPPPAPALPNGAQNNTAICQGRVQLGQGLLRTRENTATSSYNGLQMRMNGRLSNQLTYGASYTFSKGLDNASEIFSFGESFTAANPLSTGKAERSLSGFDRRNAFSSNIIWDVPLFKAQHGFKGKTLGGWQVNGTWIVASGRRYTPEQFFLEGLGRNSYQDTGFLGTFAGFDAVRPFVGNPGAAPGTVGVTDVDAAYVFGAAYTPTASHLYSLNALRTTGVLVPITLADVRYVFNGPGAAELFQNPFGTVARNSAQGLPLNQINAGLFKNTKIRENLTLQLRMDVFNLFNQNNAGYGTGAGTSIPDNLIEDVGAGANSTFANNGEISHGFRRLQFGIRIIF